MKQNIFFALPHWWFATVTLPTHFTLARMLMVPFIMVNFFAHNILLAGVLFILAALTDVIDGVLARSLQATSELGAFLDPIADKFLLISAYICLTYATLPFSIIPSWFLLLVILQECCIVGGTIYLRWVKKNYRVQPSKLGKMSTFIQILFIGWLFMCSWTCTLPLFFFYFLLGFVVGIRLWVLIHYSYTSYKEQF